LRLSYVPNSRKFIGKGFASEDSAVDYEAISDEEVRRLLKQTAPDLEIGEITDSNRETVVAFLKFFLLTTT